MFAQWVYSTVSSMLVTDFGDDNYKMLLVAIFVTDLNIGAGHQHSKYLTNFEIQSPTSTNHQHHQLKVTNIIVTLNNRSFFALKL